MASEVEICNRALTKVGEDRITALTDANERARVCNDAYAIVRDAVLRSHPWNCTIVRDTLTALVSTPDHTYTYEYDLPADYIKILEVDTPLDWIIEGAKIITDEGDTIRIRYQKQETDTEQYDALLTELLATTLAYEICERLTQSNTKKQIIGEELRRLNIMAKMHDAQESSPSKLKQDDWINVRF